MSGKVIFLMGVSGSGKTTIFQDLLATYRQLALVPSYTTRPKRIGEKEGKCIFISKSEFETAIYNQAFVEYALVHQKYYYGTKLQEIQEALNKGLVPITELDINGLEKLGRIRKIPRNYETLFLDIPDELMKIRILGRGDLDYKEVDRRIASAQQEREFAKQYCDHIIDVSGELKENIYRVNKVIDKILLN